MKYDPIIKKIESKLESSIHFSDYDFGGRDGAKCPRPYKTEWLTEQFSTLMNKLKDFLKNDPDKNQLSEFLLSEVKNIDSSLFLKEEFELLIWKYMEIPFFLLNNRTVHNYFEKNKNLLKYYS
ncbi:hypothetical protein [uncultured Aquimarina sp.]|uniref:hypothetical protein n=1 Tax=uncultured Aquimarina sp. TaxID=575652 RepID=UPI002625EA18|nr:hypothetical protein [uncultured Aquimarina sp.]